MNHCSRGTAPFGTRFGTLFALVVLAAFAAGCPGTGSGPRDSALHPRRDEAARPAVLALQAGRFEEAERAARQVLAADAQNPRARLVSAMSGYVLIGERSIKDLFAIGESLDRAALNHDLVRSVLEQVEKSLERVDAELAVAARSPEVSLELCLACWEVDWNRNGRIDPRDQRLFEIEQDADGQEIPEGDPRRRPTFRFDIGDVYWARAMISFQRAAVQLLLGYRLSDLGTDIEGLSRKLTRQGAQLVIHLGDKRRVIAARELLLAGIALAERSQQEYLAEVDDDREWVPNPRQRNHPMPLPVDAALYQTWADILVDVRKLVAGDEGLLVSEVLKLAGVRTLFSPSGYLSIRKLLFEPKDIVLSAPDLKDALLKPDDALRSLFGEAYLPSMTASRLPSRLARMRDEIRRGDDNFSRKLRYLLWLN
jgi:hypothetical protein